MATLKDVAESLVALNSQCVTRGIGTPKSFKSAQNLERNCVAFRGNKWLQRFEVLSERKSKTTLKFQQKILSCRLFNHHGTLSSNMLQILQMQGNVQFGRVKGLQTGATFSGQLRNCQNLAMLAVDFNDSHF